MTANLVSPRQALIYCWLTVLAHRAMDENKQKLYYNLAAFRLEMLPGCTFIAPQGWWLQV
jgi:hypothetical protein